MTQIFGDFISEFPPEHDSLELTFTPTSRPIKQRWRSNRLSAHFVADYLSNFLPVDEDELSHDKRKKNSNGAVSYVANELLENAMKFNDEQSQEKVKFGIHFFENIEVTAVIFTTNSVKLERANKFKAFIDEVLSCDPDELKELYIKQIEKSAESDSESSGLGLLTMMIDYAAKIGWKFETISHNPNAIAVTTLVQIAV